MALSFVDRPHGDVTWRRSAVRRWASALAPLLLGGVLAGAPSPAEATGPTIRYVSPEGGGTACTLSAPCATTRAAVNAAEAGDEVVLLPGDYPVQRIQDDAGDMVQFTRNVVVRPSARTAVTVHGFDVYAPRVTVRGFRILGEGVYLRQRADWSRVEQVEVDGSTRPSRSRSVVLAADHTALVDSWLHDKQDQDHVFIGTGGAVVKDVEVSGNFIGPATLTPGSTAHTDCLQIGTEASDVRIVRNRVYGCSNAALIIKADSGPITDVLVANNEFQGCLPAVAGCDGDYALYVRLNPATDQVMRNIQVLHNTIDGATSFSAEIPKLRVSGNIIKRLDRCGPFEDHNLIESKAPGRTVCTTLGEGDRMGSPRYLDAARRDFRPRADSPALTVGGPSGPALDIDGYTRTFPATAGAFEFDRLAWTSLSAPKSAVAGSPARLSGRLVDAVSGATVDGVVAQLWTSPAAANRWSPTMSGMTDQGRAHFARSVSRSTAYSLRFSGDRHRSAAVSSSLITTATPAFSCPARHEARPGARVALRCRVLPNLKRRAVLQVQRGNGAWKGVRTSDTVGAGRTQMAEALITAARGTTRYRFLTATDGIASRGTGPTITVLGR